MGRGAFQTGIRFGELSALKVTDIRDRGGRKGVYIRVARSVAEVNGRLIERAYTKTKAVREVPVSPALASKLTAQGKRSRDGRVFTGKGSRTIRRSQFRKVRLKAVDAAGVLGATPHGLPHACATLMANSPDVPIVAVQAMLGHASLATPSSYVRHIDDGDDPRLAVWERLAG